MKLEDFEGVSDENFVTEEEVESYYSVDEEFYDNEEGIAEEFRKQDNPKPEDYEPEEGSEDVFDAPVEVSYDREGFTGEVTQSVFVIIRVSEDHEPVHESTGSQRDAASTIFNLPNYRVIDAVDPPMGAGGW